MTRDMVATNAGRGKNNAANLPVRRSEPRRRAQADPFPNDRPHTYTPDDQPPGNQLPKPPDSEATRS